MITKIYVTETPDSGESSLGDLRFHHVGRPCAFIPLLRDPAIDELRLYCGCGLELFFPNHGKVVNQIWFVATGRSPSALQLGSYTCNIEGEVVITPDQA